MARKISILEINNDWLKIAQIERAKKSYKINRLAVKKTDLENERIRQNLVELIKDSKIKSKQVITYIPRYLLTVRNIELPSSDADEIRNMVSLQIGKETPYSRDEIISDYKIINGEKEGFSRVMLVIIRREIVDGYLSMLRSIGLQIEKIGLSSEGILNWYLMNCEDHEQDKTVALCDIDSNFTDFNIISNDNLVFTRSISIGANQLGSDAGMWQNKFVDELKRSIDIYSNEEMGKELSEFIMSGSEDNFPGMISSINSELNLPVKVIEPFKNIEMSKNLEPITDDMKRISFSAVIGVAYGAKPISIDLTPDDAKITKELEEKAKDLTFMGVLLIFIFIITMGIFFKKITDKEQIQKRLEVHLSKTKKDADALEQMMLRNELIDDRSELKGTALAIFSELYAMVPDEIYFNAVTFDQNKKVILRGASSSMSHIFKFITTLESLSYFANVRTNYATKRKLKNKELTDFEIVCPIKI